MLYEVEQEYVDAQSRSIAQKIVSMEIIKEIMIKEDNNHPFSNEVALYFKS